MSLTTQDLSSIKELVSEVVEKVVDSKIDAFAIVVGQGFNEMSQRFDKVESDIVEIKSDVAELKTDVAELKEDMQGVKWKLTDVIQRREFVGAIERIERLERKVLG